MTTISEALNTISVGLAELADALRDTGAPVSAPRPAAGGASSAPAGTFSDGTPIDEAEQWEEFAAAPLPVAAEPTGPQGFEGQCPKHRREYLPSKFKEGEFYCPEDSDEPKWMNRKGKCQITPKSAPIWLRQHAGVAA
jgi:hypothetical protein